MRHALHVPNFAEPAQLVELGVDAERSGWDGVLLWDHVFGGPDYPMPIADPWVTLGALAVQTERVLLGTAVTPLARRRPQKVAREAVTVDRLSRGRMVLGVGLGNPIRDEYGSFGEPIDPRMLAARLDEALEVISGLWTGKPYDHVGDHFTVRDAQFLPTPLQEPRIPVWVACLVPHRRPLLRAARWDGVALGALTEAGGIDALTVDQVRHAMDEISALRGGLHDFEIAVVSGGSPDPTTLDGYEELGVTWVLVTDWLQTLHQLAAAGPQR